LREITVTTERRTQVLDISAQVRDALAGDADTSAQFEAALRSSQLYMAGRERAKTNIIKVIHEVRMAMWELAARQGYTPSELCMLLADELDAFVADPGELRARLTAREEQYLGLFELDPPFIIIDEVPPLGSWPRRGERAAMPAVGPGDVLHGVPGCPGTATGTARIVLDPADPLALEPGEILVAPITDPAWTPLFVPAAAVVVEVGAQVSHAVIVSRELGIPCVVSVQDATRRIADGTKLTVDGSSGTVTVV
jgi:pyruvate,water dikinase